MVKDFAKRAARAWSTSPPELVSSCTACSREKPLAVSLLMSDSGKFGLEEAELAAPLFPEPPLPPLPLVPGLLAAENNHKQIMYIEHQ